MKHRAYLGLSYGFHDSAAALTDSKGQVLYASSEERYTRRKADCSWPYNSIKNAISFAGRNNYKIASICCHEDFQDFFSVTTGLINQKGKGWAFNLENARKKLQRYLFYSTQLKSLASDLSLSVKDIFFSDHHVSHAMASLAYSDVESAQVFVFDAYGQGASGFSGYIQNSALTVSTEYSINNSLGLFYSALTSFCGFKVLTGEYKLMGLAPYGNPIYMKQLEEFFGKPTIDSFTTEHLTPYQDKLFPSRLKSILGLESRIPESRISQNYMDLASTTQKYLELLVLDIIDNSLLETPLGLHKNILLCGGVALNCKLNYEIQNKFKDHNLYICPAAGDAGSAIGCCYAKVLKESYEQRFSNKTVLLGSEDGSKNFGDYLRILGFKVHEITHNTNLQLAENLAQGQVGAIYQGRAEFGPRALGNRSIIADPSHENALEKINREVKSREDFRPLAPVTTTLLAEKYFHVDLTSNKLLNFMLTLVSVSESTKNLIQAVVHVDNTARLQVLDEIQNPFLFSLIMAFYNRTKIPALINTSFNQRGEPIVETIDDALKCFVNANLDFIVINNSFIIRDEQDDYVLNSFLRTTSIPLD